MDVPVESPDSCGSIKHADSFGKAQPCKKITPPHLTRNFPPANKPHSTAWQMTLWPLLLVRSKWRERSCLSEETVIKPQEAMTNTRNHYLPKRLYVSIWGWNFSRIYVCVWTRLLQQRLTQVVVKMKLWLKQEERDGLFVARQTQHVTSQVENSPTFGTVHVNLLQ